MYCIVYEFKVKQGRNQEFERSWATFTKAIYRVCGSLGSRLHKTEDDLVYIAYAQWPSKEIFEKDVDLSSYTSQEIEARMKMKDSAESVKKVYLLEMIDDYLKSAR